MNKNGTGTSHESAPFSQHSFHSLRRKSETQSFLLLFQARLFYNDCNSRNIYIASSVKYSISFISIY